MTQEGLEAFSFSIRRGRSMEGAFVLGWGRWHRVLLGSSWIFAKAPIMLKIQVLVKVVVHVGIGVIF